MHIYINSIYLFFYQIGNFNICCQLQCTWAFSHFSTTFPLTPHNCLLMSNTHYRIIKGCLFKGTEVFIKIFSYM